MSNTVKSARGVEVNFDLLRIKQEMGSAPKPLDVKTRENFVDQRVRRRARKAVAELPTISKEISEAATEDVIETPEPTKTKQKRVTLKDETTTTEE